MSSLPEIISTLTSYRNPRNVKGMARFGINPKNTLGVSIPVLRKLASEIKKEYKTQFQKRHELAQELWDSEIHEARLVAGFIDDYPLVSGEQMEEWAKDFDSWDICDQVCSNLFDKTPYAYEKAKEWTKRKEEFVKESTDERNFVKKAVNWALRQIGKRNKRLRKEAIKLAQSIKEIDSKSARWTANDALRELQKLD